MHTHSQTTEASPSPAPHTPVNRLSPDTRARALGIADWLQEKKGENIAVLDVSRFSSVADVMIIVTAHGVRHAQGLADWLLDKFAEHKTDYLGMEGHAEGRWILVDGNDILIHIFQEDSRAFYNLDGLWSRGHYLRRGEHSDPVAGPSLPDQTRGVQS